MKNNKKFKKDDDNFTGEEIYQEKEIFRRFLKYLLESTSWQKTMMYIGLAGCMILLGIFIVLVENGLMR